MAQEAADAEGQEPPATEEGQAPQGDQPETFDKAYVQQLRSEAAKHRKEAQEARALAEQYEERDKSELEKLSGKLTKAQQEAQEANARLLRFEVATEKEVPAKLVPLLTATDREGLEEQANLILENAKTEPAPEFDGGPREPAPDPKTPEQEHNDLAVQLFGIRST